MTHTTSSSSPSAFHIRPPSRIIAGMDASMITSLGTWKFVIPLSLSTIATRGRFEDAYVAAIEASTSARSASGRFLIASSTAPRPLSALAPTDSSALACFSNASAKYVRTTVPKSTGSDTFIIVALRCSDTMTSSFAA